MPGVLHTGLQEMDLGWWSFRSAENALIDLEIAGPNCHQAGVAACAALGYDLCLNTDLQVLRSWVSSCVNFVEQVVSR